MTERTYVELARDARYNMVVINGCAGFGRADFHIKMIGAGVNVICLGSLCCQVNNILIRQSVPSILLHIVNHLNFLKLS